MIDPKELTIDKMGSTPNSDRDCLKDRPRFSTQSLCFCKLHVPTMVPFPSGRSLPCLSHQYHAERKESASFRTHVTDRSVGLNTIPMLHCKPSKSQKTSITYFLTLAIPSPSLLTTFLSKTTTSFLKRALSSGDTTFFSFSLVFISCSA